MVQRRHQFTFSTPTLYLHLCWFATSLGCMPLGLPTPAESTPQLQNVAVTKFRGEGGDRKKAYRFVFLSLNGSVICFLTENFGILLWQHLLDSVQWTFSITTRNGLSCNLLFLKFKSISTNHYEGAPHQTYTKTISFSGNFSYCKLGLERPPLLLRATLSEAKRGLRREAPSNIGVWR